MARVNGKRIYGLPWKLASYRFFFGKHNMLKSLVLLALKTEENNGSLSAKAVCQP